MQIIVVPNYSSTHRSIYINKINGIHAHMT